MDERKRKPTHFLKDLKTREEEAKDHESPNYT